MKLRWRQGDEGTLLKKWKQGDPQAFGVLLKRHLDAIYGLAYRLTGREDDAQDLVHNAVVRALETRAQCRDGVTFHAWMRRVVTNLFLDEVRRRDRRPEETPWDQDTLEQGPHSPAQHPRQHLAHQERAEQVQHCLAQLAPAYRTVLVLREFEDLSYQEIAETQGIPVETVRTRLRRARDQLRELLKPWMDEIP